MTHPPRIARTVLKGKRRPDQRRASNHLAFIRTLPCIACGRYPPSEAAHVRKGTDGGSGVKPSDRFSLPLCVSLHLITGSVIEGCHAKQHRVGELTFWAELQIDPLDAASALWTHSGDIEAGERIVFRARQLIGLRK